MNDKIGCLPKIWTQKQALLEIVKIAKDKRGHVMLDDQVNWLETKLEAIRLIGNRGLRVKTPKTNG